MAAHCELVSKVCWVISQKVAENVKRGWLKCCLEFPEILESCLTSDENKSRLHFFLLKLTSHYNNNEAQVVSTLSLRMEEDETRDGCGQVAWPTACVWNWEEARLWSRWSESEAWTQSGRRSMRRERQYQRQHAALTKHTAEIEP